MNQQRIIIATSGGGFGEHRDTYYSSGLPPGVEHYPEETGPIDQLIIKASRKPNPKVCCIMTASDGPMNDTSGLESSLKKRFSRLGASVEFMRLTYYYPNDDEVKSQLESADIIYVSGGTSYNLAQTLKRRGVDQILVGLSSQGAVLSGLSAGLCCWFSDVNACTNGTVISQVKGLGWYKALIAPHWEREPHRHKPFHQILLDNPGLVGLAFDECTAIEINGDQYRLHQFGPGGQIHRGQFDETSGSYSFKPLEINPDFKPLSDLGITSSLTD